MNKTRSTDTVCNDLLKRCLRGDDEAWKELIKRYETVTRDHVRGILFKHKLDYLATNHLDEIVNYVFTELYRNLPSYKFSNFEVWFAILRRTKTIQYIRSELRFESRHSFGKEDSYFSGDKQSEEFQPEKAPSAWGSTSRDDVPYSKILLMEVLGLVEDLPEKYRLIYKLYFLEGLEFVEISRLLKTKETTARTRLRRAISKIREMVESDGRRDTMEAGGFCGFGTDAAVCVAA